jgi:hypothetical protein
MKLEELKLTITRLEDGLDKDGNTYLKAKGYNTYKSNGKHAFNFFSNIKLYPINETQFEETKNRLFSQTEEKPKINIIAYQSELVTPLQNGTLRANLICYRFDFAKNKLFRKKELLNYGKDN